MDSAVVDQAAEWANFMVLREARGPGDLPNAMERLERRYGIASRPSGRCATGKPKDVAGFRSPASPRRVPWPK
jgi:hypothetical protein